MKSLEELKKIRDEFKKNLVIRDTNRKTRIVVCMDSCGISAGAKSVLQTLLEEVDNKKLSDVQVVQTVCIGRCRDEPIIEVYKPGEDKITYISVDSRKAKRIISEHIINGKVVKEYTINS